MTTNPHFGAVSILASPGRRGDIDTTHRKAAFVPESSSLADSKSGQFQTKA
jgi:hypothetical protein